ncbi:C40 family peptidase [Streptomyces corynorhini]|uniref:Glycoside hydrolase n=1 Tax=Streptomyces corynorhini TaxID=2282652 RepID=A0A370AXS5_9ACTN|nr:C40 family peptidase [Streptomyces corynorhini]RDG31895.1 glycoside hydrolase [Streptomyces corynorhini]
MSGRALRAVCARAAVLTAAVVLAGVPLAPYATAEPTPPGSASTPGSAPGSAPESESGSASTPGAAPVPAAEDPSGAADSAEPAAPADPAGLAPESGASTTDSSVSGLLSRLRLLYQQTEEATETYNATAVALARQRAETKKLTADLDRARKALTLSRSDAGELARAQYRGQSELSSYLRLLLAHDPLSAIDESYLLERAARERAAALTRLTGGEKRAAALTEAARAALGQQQALATKQKKQRDMVTSRLREVEKLLASLSGAQIAAVTALERDGTDKAQRELIGSGALGSPGAPGAPGAPATGVRSAAPSAAGSAALDFAVAQIGKPYEWGAEGPDSFDCSGLTSRAWARAGHTIPRTSQEQWSELPRVSLRELRPGDLVVYFPKATHVAIYLGDGLVIQAPRPGSLVKVSPLAANPLLGAVRPDPQAAALDPAAYEPPRLPRGATDGSDTGNDQEG